MPRRVRIDFRQLASVACAYVTNFGPPTNHKVLALGGTHTRLTGPEQASYDARPNQRYLGNSGRWAGWAVSSAGQKLAIAKPAGGGNCRLEPVNVKFMLRAHRQKRATQHQGWVSAAAKHGIAAIMKLGGLMALRRTSKVLMHSGRCRVFLFEMFGFLRVVPRLVRHLSFLLMGTRILTMLPLHKA